MYFAFAVNDQDVDALVWHKMADASDVDSIMLPHGTILNNDYFTETGYTILDLPSNKVYAISNDIDIAAVGLPVKTYGTLFKYSPYTTDAKTGFVSYHFSAAVYAGDKHQTEEYFAFAVYDQTVETLEWHRYNIAEVNRGINDLGMTDTELSIVFIGDSIVEGYGSSDYNGGAKGTSGHLIENNVKTWYRNTGAKCWANQMIDYLTSTYSNVKACNNGIGGFTPQQIYDNLDTLTLDDDGNRADVAILSIGTNSRNASDKTASIKTPILRTIRWLKYNGIQPIVLTNVPAIGLEKGKNSETVQSYILAACEAAGVKCYDLLSRMKCYLWEHDIPIESAADQSKLMRDYLHPSDIGYEIMFNLIKELLIV